MSDVDSEEYFRSHHKKHKSRKLSPDSCDEYRKGNKSYKHKSRERYCDRERKKMRTHSREYVKVKSEPVNGDDEDRRDIKTESREEKNNRIRSSGSRSRTRFHPDNNRERETHGWGENTNKSKQNKPPGETQKPNFGLSGKLAEDTNIFNGVVIKYSEPPEARMPKKRWRLYPFKGDQGLPTLYIHRQSAYLLGRDRKVVDIPIDHPSCSKQHAALQYRLVTYNRPNGSLGKQIRLYIIDLESANGTFINNNKIESKKYVELFEKDVIKFGYSSREYVLLHEHSKDDENSDEEQ